MKIALLAFAEQAVQVRREGSSARSLREDAYRSLGPVCQQRLAARRRKRAGVPHKGSYHFAFMLT
jgi:hypothetical protein